MNPNQMNPKEKAIQLFKECYSIVSGLPIDYVSKIIEEDHLQQQYVKAAKQLVLKMIDETLNAVSRYNDAQIEVIYYKSAYIEMSKMYN